MKTMFLAAAAALTFGIGSAYAQASPSGSGYVYPDFWGNQTARTAPQDHAATQSSDDAISTFATHTENNGTWLFPPNPLGGGG
jgi:hypothetical protein